MWGSSQDAGGKGRLLQPSPVGCRDRVTAQAVRVAPVYTRAVVTNPSPPSPGHLGDFADHESLGGHDVRDAVGAEPAPGDAAVQGGLPWGTAAVSSSTHSDPKRPRPLSNQRDSQTTPIPFTPRDAQPPARPLNHRAPPQQPLSLRVPQPSPPVPAPQVPQKPFTPAPSRPSPIPSHAHGSPEASSGHSPGLRQLNQASPSSLLQREETAVSGAGTETRTGTRTGTQKGTVPTSTPGSSRSGSAASPPSLPW